MGIITSCQAVVHSVRLRGAQLAPSSDIINDFIMAVCYYRFWWELSLNDIRGRYRRTMMGPWWLVIGNSLMLSGMAFVWSVIFHTDIRDFFPFLVAGFTTWGMLASFLTEGCQTFSGGSASSIQKNISLPKTIHAFRLVSRVLLLFGHNIVFYVVVAIAFRIPVTIWTVLALPGLVLLALNGVWMVITLGVIGARFRDVEPLVGALMTFLFLVTPIMWQVEVLGDHRGIAYNNPFYHLIEVVRAPLLGHHPQLISYLVVLSMLVCGYLSAYLLLRHSKYKLVFWL